MSQELTTTSKKSTVGAWIFMGLCILYDVSPVDIIPDIPVVGWIDDFFVTATGALNLIQAQFAESLTVVSKIAKYLKWIIVILGIIAIISILLLGGVIIKLFTK